ncbi:trigger factor [Altericista sp. CCNU0014]|uniref:trigger factor n=1 Tax=Altericista sp. CCNU0014 TaxID=3082949 RepID=UPI00384E743E
MSKTREQLKVTQETLPGSQIGLEIEISPERSRQAYEQTVTHFMKSAQIPGFRRGKVPRQVVLQRFGAMQLKAATLEELVEKTFKEALEQEEIPALGNFQLRSSFDELLTQFEPGSAVTYSASIDVPPKATLKRYTEFQITAEEVKPDPAQVDRVIDEQRASRSTLIPVEGRAAEAGDVAVIDFSGQYFLGEDKTDPQDIEGGSAEDFQVELSEGQLIPGFIEGIIGMSPEDTKELELQFPEGYFQEDLAGKSAVFSVTLKEIKTKELPELDDEFVKEISEFETLAELRQFLEERYQKEAQSKTDENVETALIDALVEQVEVDLPETAIVNEANFLINQLAARLQSQGMDVKRLFPPDSIDALRDRFRDEAIGRLKRTLALAEVAARESLKVETEALEQRFREVFEQLDDPKSIDRDRLRDALEDELLKEKVVAWLKEHSEIELVDKIEVEPVPEETAIAAEATVETSASEVVEDELLEVVEDDQPEPEEPKKSPRRRTTKAKAAGEES